MSELLTSPSLDEFARELLSGAADLDDITGQGFADPLDAVPIGGSPWTALPVAADDAVRAIAAEEASADLMADMHPVASNDADTNAAAGREPDNAALDWLLPFVDAEAPDELAPEDQQQLANGAAAAAAPDARLASMKERSRLAQQRYRAKQRQKLKSSTAQVQELTRELESLRTQQAESQRREALFQRFVASHSLSQQPEAGLRAGENASISSADSSGRILPGDEEAAVQPASWEDLRSKLWTVPDMARLAYRGKTSAEFWGESLAFTACGDPPVCMTREQISRLSTAEYGSMWKAIVNGLAGCFLAVSEDSKSAASKRLRAYVAEARELKKTLIFLQPNTILEYSKQLAAQHRPPTAELWRSIARTVTLSPEQQRRCGLLRHAAYMRLGALLRRRAEVAQSMTAVPDLQDADVTGSLATDYLGSAPMAERMQDMLREENSLAAQLQGCLYGNVLSALQCCHCHVLAYPFEANPLALLDAFVASSARPATPPGQLLRQGAAAEGEQRLPSLLEAAPPLATDLAAGSLTA